MSQFPRDILWIHRNPDKMKVVTVVEQMYERNDLDLHLGHLKP